MKAKVKTQDTSPHIGNILSEHIKTHRIYKSAIARHLQRGSSTIEYYTRSKSIQLSILWKLSVALKHNFFADLAAELPVEFTNNVPIDTSKDKEIERLTQENKLLQAQLETLEKVLRVSKSNT